MTLDDRLESIAQLRDVLDMTEGYLAELVDDVERDEAAADELRAAIETLKVQIEAWNADVAAILERRARIAAALAKCRPPRTCRRCGLPASPRSVGNIEDMLAFIADAEPLDASLPRLVPEMQALCGGCFGSRLRGLEALSASIAAREVTS